MKNINCKNMWPFKKIQYGETLSLMPEIKRLNSKNNIRIIESVDGIWIERQIFYEKDACESEIFTGSGIIGNRWESVDFFGRPNLGTFKYKSVAAAKKRIKETNRFKDIVISKIISV